MERLFENIGQFVKRKANTFDLFPAYLKAIYTRWNEWIWETLSFAVFAICINFWSPPMLWTIAIVGTALIIATYHTWRVDHLRLIPKISFDNEVHTAFAEAFDENGDHTRVRYVQLLPMCLTEAPVEECQGKLLRVWELKNGEWSSTDLDEPLDLNWSFHNSNPRTLLPKIQQRLNVAWADNKTGFSLCVEQNPLKAREIFGGANLRNTFRFDVALTAKDCAPVSVSIQATITRTYQNERDGPIVEAKILDVP